MLKRKLYKRENWFNQQRQDIARSPLGKNKMAEDVGARPCGLRKQRTM